MTIFKNFFKFIWKIFDILMFLGFAISLNITMFHWNWIAGGLALSVTFILAGLISEMIGSKKEGD